MFSTMDNASKAAFITLGKVLEQEEFLMIDCQVYTNHLESLGAVHISKEKFLELVEKGNSIQPLNLVINKSLSTYIKHKDREEL